MRAAKLAVILLLPACSPPAASSCAAAPNCPATSCPFTTIALGLAPTSEFYAQLKRTIEASSPGTRVVADPRRRKPSSRCSATRSEKNILSLNAAGRAREFQLVRTFSFKVHGQCSRRPRRAPQVKYTDAPALAGPTEYIPPSTITLRRDITFSDDLVLSKESEEALLWRDIQGDLVQQLMRRLAAAKLQAGQGRE
jgi:LPS-assembly lipoprotein